MSKKIYGFYNISNTDYNMFNKDLENRIEELQNIGLEIEIQYTTNILQRNIKNPIVYNALILGRK